jgi:hypothetical protein
VHVNVEKVRSTRFVDVEQFEAHLALRATPANILQVVAGVHVHLGTMK